MFAQRDKHSGWGSNSSEIDWKPTWGVEWITQEEKAKDFHGSCVIEVSMMALTRSSGGEYHKSGLWAKFIRQMCLFLH